jgi:hypothetical protein
MNNEQYKKSEYIKDIIIDFFISMFLCDLILKFYLFIFRSERLKNFCNEIEKLIFECKKLLKENKIYKNENLEKKKEKIENKCNILKEFTDNINCITEQNQKFSINPKENVIDKDNFKDISQSFPYKLFQFKVDLLVAKEVYKAEKECSLYDIQ